jgi:hypothetical protein
MSASTTAAVATEGNETKLTYDWTDEQLPEMFRMPTVTDKVHKLNEEDAVFVKNELNEDRETRFEFLGRLREHLLTKYPPEDHESLMIRTDNNWLIKFARARKYDFDRTVTMLEIFYEFRRKKGYTRANRPPLEHFNVLNDFGHVAILDQTDQHRRTIIVVDSSKMNLSTLAEKLSPEELAHLSFYMMLSFIRHDNLTVRGCTLIQDLAAMSLWSMLKAMGGNDNMKKAQQERMELMNGLPMRVKCILMVDAPMWLSALMVIARQFMAAKMKKRMHTIARAQLSEFVDESVLPASLRTH